MRQLFSQLEFDVRVYDNLSVGEIKEAIQDCKFLLKSICIHYLIQIRLNYFNLNVLMMKRAIVMSSSFSLKNPVYNF